MPPLPAIPLSGGLVTSRDPTFLTGQSAPGELQEAADVEYLPDDPSPWKIAGRVPFSGSPESTTITGLAMLEFDRDPTKVAPNDLIVIQVGTKYRSAPVGSTGVFSDLVTGLNGASRTLDTVHLANQHFLLNGIDRNRYIGSDGVPLIQGMLAAIFQPLVDTAAGALTGYTLGNNKTMTYWIEERVKDAHGLIVKRHASTVNESTTITGTGALIKPRITRPDIVNSETTHWAAYATATNGLFPTGAELGEVPVSTMFIDDPRTGTDPALPAGTTYLLNTSVIAGITQSVARYGPPPISSTGDIFKTCLCLNDIHNPRRLWFSYYREPQAMPANNFLDMETKEHDEIVAIRRCGKVLILGLRDSLWRMTDLPFPQDADSTPENFLEQVDGAFGVVGPMATAYMMRPAGEFPRESLLLVYVSLYGLIATDGEAWWVLSRDIDWPATFDVNALHTAILRNNAAKFRLELYANSTTGQRVCYYFHYHPSHLKQGMTLKVTGPIHRDATAACMVRLNGILVPFTAAGDQRVYVNDSGTVEPSGAGGIHLRVRTGVFYPFGPTTEGIIRTLLIHHSAGAGSQIATVVLTQYDEHYTPSPASATISLAAAEGTTAFQEGAGEAFDILIDNADTLGRFRLNFIGLTAQPAGEAQPS